MTKLLAFTRCFGVFALLGMPLSCTAYSSNAVAKLPGGLILQIIDPAVSCNGGPIAILLDKNGRNRDQTCNVHITDQGVTTFFASYGKPVFWYKDQFTVMDPVPKVDRRVRALMEKEEALNNKCRGGSGDDPKTSAACDQREKTLTAIKAAGWCWGHANDIGANRRWVECQPGD